MMFRLDVGRHLFKKTLRSGVAVLVAAVFLMAGSCPGGEGSGDGGAPSIIVLDGTTPVAPGSTKDLGSAMCTIAIMLTIANAGDAVLDLSGTPPVQITGISEWSITTQPQDAIDPGNTTDFIIQFTCASCTGSTTVNDPATVTIESNDPDYPGYSFTVTGSLSCCSSG